jgi:pilus assembly protein CpaB
MKTRRVPLIIGIILALGTGVLLLGYLTSLRPSAAVGQTRSVLVATHDIPARAAATSDLFTAEDRIATQLDSDAISDPKDLAGNYTLVAIPAGSVATRSKIGLASASTVPARLEVGMRAVSIAIDNVKGIAGLITPGDRVDVIADLPGLAGTTPRAAAILRGALVLAIGSDVSTTTTGPPGPLSAPAPALTTITLAVTPSQADRLVGADLNSTLRLALRNPKESLDAFPAESLTLAVAGPVNSTAAAPLPVAQPERAPANSTPNRVMVINGDQVEAGHAASP